MKNVLLILDIPSYIWYTREILNASMLFVLNLHKNKYHDRELAKEELKALFYDYDFTLPTTGPLMDQKGTMWIDISDSYVEVVKDRFNRLGFIEKVSYLEKTDTGQIKWKGENYSLIKVFDDTLDNAEKLSFKQKKRLALLEKTKFEMKLFQTEDERNPLAGLKDLPTADAKLLINLVYIKKDQVFLDPFAGIGSIVIEALNAEYLTMSSDVEPKLKPGLMTIGSKHKVTDTKELTNDTSSIDAIATELPFSPKVKTLIYKWMMEMTRVLKPKGKLAIMCTYSQSVIIKRVMKNMELNFSIETKRGSKKVQVMLFTKKAF